jgi:hypothetical protein
VSQYSELFIDRKYYLVPTLITVTVLCVGHRKAPQAVPYALEFAADERRSFSAPMRYHASASTPLAFYAVLCHHVALLTPFMTSLPTAHLPGARASAWERFAHGCSVNEMAYCIELIISPDPHNKSPVICSLSAFSRKHRSCSARVRLKEPSALHEATSRAPFPTRSAHAH